MRELEAIATKEAEERKSSARTYQVQFKPASACHPEEQRHLYNQHRQQCQAGPSQQPAASPASIPSPPASSTFPPAGAEARSPFSSSAFRTWTAYPRHQWPARGQSASQRGTSSKDPPLRFESKCFSL